MTKAASKILEAAFIYQLYLKLLAWKQFRISVRFRMLSAHSCSNLVSTGSNLDAEMAGRILKSHLQQLTIRATKTQKLKTNSKSNTH
jgi:hypothetical protein